MTEPPLGAVSGLDRGTVDSGAAGPGAGEAGAVAAGTAPASSAGSALPIAVMTSLSLIS